MPTFTYQATVCDDCHGWEQAELDGPCMHYRRARATLETAIRFAEVTIAYSNDAATIAGARARLAELQAMR